MLVRIISGGSMRGRFSYPILCAVAAIALFSGATTAQARQSIVHRSPIGLVQDWSHQSVVFSNPDTPEEARANGRMPRWNRLAADPRFQQSLLQKLQAQSDANARGNGRSPLRPRPNPLPGPAPSPTPQPQTEGALHRDWSNVLGGGANGLGGNGSAGAYPAKYSFDIFATPSCANDFIVHATSGAGADSNGTQEQWVASFGGDPTAGQTVTIGTTAPRSVTLTASATLNTGLNFQFTGNTTTNAANLAAAINRWAGQTGFSATTDGAAQVTIRSNTVGNVTNGLVTEALGNFGGLVRTNGASVSVGQPTIIAFNQLYNGSCDGTRSEANAPNVYWSYNTGTGRIVETSPVLSYFDNALQVAFIQRNPTPNPDQLELVLLKWSAASPGTAAAPTTPTAVTAANYRSCTAPCMTTFVLSGTSNTDNATTFSSPFVDYFSDILWVGDGASKLHKFTGVFAGTPAEVTAGGFPATVVAGQNVKLSSPVYDFAGNVFLGSQGLIAGTQTGGRLHRVDASTGTVTDSAKLVDDTINIPGIRSSPLMDVTTGHVYAFLFDDGTTDCNTLPCQAVVQFDTAFAAGSTGTKATLGQGGGGAITYLGAFNRAYFSSPSHDGALYTCGTTPTDNTAVVLYRIPITGGLMGTPVQGAQLGAGVAGSCSAVGRVLNGSNEYLYVSVPDNGTAAGCAGACLYMVNLADLNGATAGTGAAWASTNAASAGLSSPGGASGVVIDNVSASPGTSQVYYSQLASPGNAIQASQAGLQ